MAAVIGANESPVVEFPKLAPKALIVLLIILASLDLTAKAVVLLPSTVIVFPITFSLLPLNSIP